MPSPVPGFPQRFPVRDDDRRPLRYHFMAGLTRLCFRAVYQWRLIHFEGVENIPDAPGPLILASNHLSNLDPLLYGGFFPRTLFAMAKRELFPNRFAAWMWGGSNTFPIDRGRADRQALRTAIDVLRRGGRLLLFIEGTRAPSPGMTRVEPGVGFLLRRASADGSVIPVLPAAVWGTERALVRGKFFPQRVPLHVRYGEVFTPSLSAARDDQALADQVAARVAALLPPEYRGVYSGTV
ncbi:MAG TPA: lysophospholipid acyltransferase family protein [Candidatus Angelobacter sp.]|nr:lysophospholipid acyltransferase family protein [Candidatus Angelobacter sp.]